MRSQITSNTVGWMASLFQSSKFSAVCALSFSLVLSACGDGGNSVTDNVAADPAGSDGIAPTLSSVTIANVDTGKKYAKLGDKVKLQFTATESLMKPTVTIGGVAATVSGQHNGWSAVRTMTSEDTDGVLAFEISFSDVSGESGVSVTAATVTAEEGKTGAWDSVEYCADGSCVVEDVIVTEFDFEDNSLILNWKDIGTASGDVNPGVLSEIVADPDDASNSVVKSSVTEGSQFYAGAYLVVGEAVAPDLSVFLSESDSVISIRVRPAAAGQEVQLKLELATNNAVNVSARAYTTKAGEWETLYFDFAEGVRAGGAIDATVEYGAFFVIYDFAKTADSATQTWYWDDIKHGGVVKPDGVNEPPAAASKFASWGEFGGMTDADDTYTFPASAESWGGFSNTNATLYPFKFPLGGKITFKAAIPAGGLDTSVKFRFEDVPGGNPGFAFDTDVVVVSGATETAYTVSFDKPSSDADLTSFLMYVVERDSPIIIKDVKVTATAATTITWGEFGGMAQTGDVVSFPAAAQSWGGFSNLNTSLYPFTFPYGGSISFTGSIPAGGADTSVKFRFEDIPGGNPGFAFNTDAVVVSGSTATTYTVTFDAPTSSVDLTSFLMYVVERDQDVSVSNVVVTKSPNTAVSWGEFGGMAQTGDVVSFPAAAQSWGGFSNLNTSLYPFTFPYGGSISFTGSIPAGGADTSVKFRFEDIPGGNPGFAFNTDAVVVSGSTATTYTVTFDAPTSSVDLTSFLMYVVERDQDVSVSNVVVTKSPNTAVSWGEFGGMAQTGDVVSFPAAAQSWGGFSNLNTSLYPFTFPYGGSISFTGSIPAGGADTSVKFRFEDIPGGNPGFAFNTDAVVVSGSTATTYTVTFDAPTSSVDLTSFLMYVVERDQDVSVSNVRVTPQIAQ